MAKKLTLAQHTPFRALCLFGVTVMASLLAALIHPFLALTLVSMRLLIALCWPWKTLQRRDGGVQQQGAAVLWWMVFTLNSAVVFPSFLAWLGMQLRQPLTLRTLKEVINSLVKMPISSATLLQQMWTMGDDLGGGSVNMLDILCWGIIPSLGCLAVTETTFKESLQNEYATPEVNNKAELKTSCVKSNCSVTGSTGAVLMLLRVVGLSGVILALLRLTNLPAFLLVGSGTSSLVWALQHMSTKV
jgi:hypothetical protein